MTQLLWICGLSAPDPTGKPVNRKDGSRQPTMTGHLMEELVKAAKWYIKWYIFR
jgi:hypothetical protein